MPPDEVQNPRLDVPISQFTARELTEYIQELVVGLEQRASIPVRRSDDSDDGDLTKRTTEPTLKLMCTALGPLYDEIARDRRLSTQQVRRNQW